MASFWYITLITIDVVTNGQNYFNASIFVSIYIHTFFYDILFILLFIFYYGLKPIITNNIAFYYVRTLLFFFSFLFPVCYD